MHSLFVLFANKADLLVTKYQKSNSMCLCIAIQTITECQSISFSVMSVDDAEKDYPISYKNLTLPDTLDASEVTISVNQSPPNGSYQLGSMTIAPQRNSIRSLYQTTMDVGIGVQDYVKLSDTLNVTVQIIKNKYPTFSLPQNITLYVGVYFTLSFAEIVSDVETPFSQLTVTCFAADNSSLPSFVSCNSTHRKFYISLFVNASF